MPLNLEVKARIPARAAEIARDLCSPETRAPHGLLIQEDTYFAVPQGRLKLRKIEGAAAELIYYERPGEMGARFSSYEKLEVAEPERLVALLSRACGVRGIVSKRRELYLYQSFVRIHIDDVKSLGKFIEIEVPSGEENGSQEEAARQMSYLVGTFGIAPNDYFSGSYIDMIAGEGRGR